MKPIDPNQIELLDDAMVEVLRRKTLTERLAIAFAGNRAVRLRLAGYFQTQHPNWSAAQIEAAVAQRLLDGAS